MFRPPITILPGATKKMETIIPARMKPNAFTLRPYLSATAPQNHAPNNDPKAEIEKIKNIVTNFNGTVDKVNEWGQRRLAYEIDKKRDGYYVIINFTSNADAVNEVDRICKISDNVLRHMITVEESK